MTEWDTCPAATRAAVTALSQGTCYFPGCRTPIVVLVGGRPEINVDAVRIRGSEPGGRPSFGDLVLLCVPHRRIVGRDARAYPPDLLEIWQPGPAALRELRDLTEDRLDDLLTTAFSAAQEEAQAHQHPDDADAGVAAALAELARRLSRIEDDIARLAGNTGRSRTARAATVVERSGPATIGWRS